MMKIQMAYEFLDHTADVAIRVTAGTPADLLAEAARAFYAVLLDEESVRRVEPRVERTVDIDGIDGEMVLVDFLNELIYRFDAENLILPEVTVEEARLDRGDARLRARLRGERFDPARHRLRTGVKAATYHGLRIEESGGKLTVEVVLDL
jgi:SHS2 domain-containing protein